MTASSLTWRVASDDDLPFLREVYASTRADELAPLNWSDEQVNAFLSLQFDAQHASYRTHYPDADFLVLMLGEDPVGRLYLHSGEAELFVIDIALLPAHRGSGLGTGVLRVVMDEAARTGRPVRLYVDKASPALHLYQRLGFRTIGDHGLSSRMEWRPV